MKILYVLQQSIYNNEGKWISADSNINMMVGMLRELEVLKPDWHFHVLISPIKTFADITSLDMIYKGKNLTWVEYPFPVNAFTNRYNFNARQFGAVLDDVKPDVVWNNICELTRNMKTVARQQKQNPKFITSNYWMDCPFIGEGKTDEDISYFWRQFDGFECSDLSTFTCESTKDAFFKNARLAVTEPHLVKIENRSVIFDFGYSVKEMESGPLVRGESPIVGFLNRLSGINYTHHDEFIAAMNKIDTECRVFFSNPSMKANPDELISRIPNHEVLAFKRTLSRRGYVDMLNTMDISVHLYTLERYGGCAVREAIEAKNIIIAPRVHEYARILGSDYKFYVKNDLSDLAEVIDRAIKHCNSISRDKSKALSASILERNRQSSFEVVAKDVVAAIEKL
jgi:hypothetical protein